VTAVRGRLEMRQPEYERIDDDEPGETVHGGRIVPLYPLTRGISQKWMRSLLRTTLDSHLACVEEVLPQDLRNGLPDRRAALQALHFPDSLRERDRAVARFKLEELFFLQLLLARRRHAGEHRAAGRRLQPRRGLHQQYLDALPFQLTTAQQRVLCQIVSDLQSGRWMQRLVQGDVGSGKTVLAVAALLLAIDAGTQGVLMAPTEALALQHADRLVSTCAQLAVRLGVLVGSQSERDKESMRARMRSGDVDLVIGTHALIQEGVEWARLGLAVVDEQQRFGVLQRGALQGPAQADIESRPHVLVLSATPIPRSLALTLFGDLHVSRLDEKPPGRQKVETRVVPTRRRRDMLLFIRQHLLQGSQAYMVFPLIEESDKMDLQAATQEFDRLRSGPLADVRMGLLHGRLPANEKQQLLERFHRGELQLLVSTTVVEVGMDVGNATIMVVHHPERFGLSQLHQLRGRVGRSDKASWCFLLPSPRTSAEGLERLQEFADTDDGFAIAELDLRLRGPGDFLGTRQHGLPTLRFADLSQDLDLLERVRQRAFALVEADPELEKPEHACVRRHLERQLVDKEILAAIG
jgi:ATP-dependent DNA helicase RecG